MSFSRKIALVGDYSPDVVAHRAIPKAFELVNAAQSVALTGEWVGTAGIRDAARDLAGFDAVWLVPASPYMNMAGALDAIRWARTTQRPFLGTCGGFQHALIEFARNVAGIAAADHAESSPGGDTLVVTQLSCSLAEKSSRVYFRAGSKLNESYGQKSAEEGYHCSYGVNPAYRESLEKAGLVFTAFDDAGDIRAFELPTAMHPFFVGTLFQSERRALTGRIPPLVAAFMQATLTSPANR